MSSEAKQNQATATPSPSLDGERSKAIVEQFTSSLIPADPDSEHCIGAFVEMGDWNGKEYEYEGDHGLMIDPLGNAWIGLGPHVNLPKRKGD